MEQAAEDGSLSASRFLARTVLTIAFTVSTCLFAHRSFIYMEIGGDFALARRSGAVMIILLLVSAIVEAYYVSACLAKNATRGRLMYMVVIAAIAALTILPQLLLEYLNFEIYLMQIEYL
jgi:hypothetical protein